MCLCALLRVTRSKLPASMSGTEVGGVVDVAPVCNVFIVLQYEWVRPVIYK